MAKDINDVIKKIDSENPYEELVLHYDITPLPYARPRRSKKLEKAGLKNPFYNPRSKYKKDLIKLIEEDLKSIEDFKIIEGEVKLYLEFGINSPKSLNQSKTKWLLILKKFLRPITRPDVDNYAKPILDALNKKVYVDDGQIVLLHCEKFYTTELEKPYINIKIVFRQNKIKLR